MNGLAEEKAKIVRDALHNRLHSHTRPWIEALAAVDELESAAKRADILETALDDLLKWAEKFKADNATSNTYTTALSISGYEWQTVRDRARKALDL